MGFSERLRGTQSDWWWYSYRGMFCSLSHTNSDSDISGLMTCGPKQIHYKQDQYVQRLWGESINMK